MDETNVNPESEKIDSKTKVTENVTEGTVEAEMLKDAPTEFVEAESVKETVPLSVFLSLKDDMKELKKEIKNSSSSNKNSVRAEGVKNLSEKYPDVNEDFISDILSSAKNEALQEVESKYSPIIERQRYKDEQETFNKAFDTVYEKALKDNPELPKNIDKELIKTLVVTPKYKNVKISDILTQIYPNNNEGKQSSENDTVSSSGDVETITSFDKITNDQKTVIMADPKARQKYFNWLDTQTGR